MKTKTTGFLPSEVATEIGTITDAMMFVVDCEDFGPVARANALHSFIDHLNRIAEDLRKAEA